MFFIATTLTTENGDRCVRLLTGRCGGGAVGVSGRGLNMLFGVVSRGSVSVALRIGAFLETFRHGFEGKSEGSGVIRGLLGSNGGSIIRDRN